VIRERPDEKKIADKGTRVVFFFLYRLSEESYKMGLVLPGNLSLERAAFAVNSSLGVLWRLTRVAMRGFQVEGPGAQ